MKDLFSMNKVSLLMLAFLLVIALCGCGNSSDRELKRQLEQLQQENDELKKQIGDLSNGETNENGNAAKDDMILKTANSLEIYLELLGTHTDEKFSLNVSDEFIEGLTSVYVMGRTGTVSHGSTEDTGTLINLMEWTDNEPSDEVYLQDFVKLLNEYYGKEGTQKSYDNLSDETYVWIDYDYHCYVACWYQDGIVQLRWDYNDELQPTDMEEILTESSNSTTTTTQKSKSSNTQSSFTNKYGTATTICAHSGCTSFIAKSGDTNCCETHSNLCAECGCYIDEDALFCLSCIEKAVEDINSDSQSYHTCEVSGCSKEGTYSVAGLNGTLEYYCNEHYSEMLNLYEKMFG